MNLLSFVMIIVLAGIPFSKLYSNEIYKNEVYSSYDKIKKIILVQDKYLPIGITYPEFLQSEQFHHSIQYQLAARKDFELLKKIVKDDKMSVRGRELAIRALEAFSAYETLKEIALQDGIGYNSRDEAIQSLGRSGRYSGLLFEIANSSHYVQRIRYNAIVGLGLAKELNMLRSIAENPSIETDLRQSAISAMFINDIRVHKLFISFLLQNDIPMSIKEEIMRLSFLGAGQSAAFFSLEISKSYKKIIETVIADNKFSVEVKAVAQIYQDRLTSETRKGSSTTIDLKGDKPSIKTDDPDLRIKAIGP